MTRSAASRMKDTFEVPPRSGLTSARSSKAKASDTSVIQRSYLLSVMHNAPACAPTPSPPTAATPPASREP